MRITANCQNVFASPQPAVITLQKAMPTAMIARRLRVSARRPSGMPKNV